MTAPSRRVFVTGASGFIGRAVMDELARCGHQPVGLSRQPDQATATGDLVAGDVTEPDTWAHHLAGVDVVVHLAASIHGDEATQRHTTVDGTAALLDAMARQGVDRLVHVSTVAVYDYRRIAAHGVLDETSPLLPSADGPEAAARDAYARTKLAQEELVRRFGRDGGRVTILRPGLVWSAENHWDGGHLLGLGPLGLAVAPGAALKLAHVDNVASAIVCAVERDDSAGAVLNLFDDDLPSQRAFAAAARRGGAEVSRSLPVPWSVMRRLAGLLGGVDRLTGHRLPLPGLFRPAQLAAKAKPLSYPNDLARARLGWTPDTTLGEAFAR